MSKVPADRTSHPGVQEQAVKVLVLLGVLWVQKPWRQQEQRLERMNTDECQLHQKVPLALKVCSPPRSRGLLHALVFSQDLHQGASLLYFFYIQ